MTGRARTVFLGSGSFAIPILADLASHPRVELAAVVSAPPRPSGRGARVTPSPVGKWAAERSLPTLTPARLRAPEALDEIRRLQPTLIVLADYGQLVPSALLELPADGALNVHPSLLPRHRGASPVAAAILAGDSQTGVTLMLMDEGLDTGPIIAQRSIPLDGTETLPALEERLARLGAQLLSESLGPWLDGELRADAQPSEGATVTGSLRREDGRLDPTRPAVDLERRVRAHQPWPGSFVETSAGRLTVWRARVLPPVAAPVGSLVTPSTDRSRGLALVTADGALELLEVQPADGRRMSGAELVRGRPALLGSTVAAAPNAGSTATSVDRR